MDLEQLKRKFIKSQFSGKMRERTYRKLATFLRNGVSLPDALRIMYEHESEDGKYVNRPQAVILNDWRKQIANGRSFGRAVREWVPPGDRIILEAGEESGRLDQALENALFIQGSSRKIKSAIVGGLAYPALLMALAMGFMVMFGLWIVPAFEDVVPRQKWTGTAAKMAGVADFVNTWMLPTVLTFLALCGLVVWSLPRWTGPIRIKLDKYPPWSLYRLMQGSGFMLSMSALVRAGVQIPEILRILARGAPPRFQERMQATLRYVSNGINIGEALHKTGYNFPDVDTVKDLRSYANLDGFDENLEKIGRQWVEESVDMVKGQMVLMRNVSLIFLGVVFGTIAVGIFALQQTITDNTSTL